MSTTTIDPSEQNVVTYLRLPTSGSISEVGVLWGKQASHPDVCRSPVGRDKVIAAVKDPIHFLQKEETDLPSIVRKVAEATQRVFGFSNLSHWARFMAASTAGGLQMANLLLQ